jgi:hypothetical protein
MLMNNPPNKPQTI